MAEFPSLDADLPGRGVGTGNSWSSTVLSPGDNGLEHRLHHGGRSFWFLRPVSLTDGRAGVAVGLQVVAMGYR